jgi:hypothetical protein
VIGYLRPVFATPAIRDRYRSYQCGLCHTIGAEYGFRYRVFAGPDLVFYNVFLDQMAGAEPSIAKRACVLGPGISSLPVRAATDHTRIAAAFGIYMAVEKLKDDYQDDGGLHRWLVVKAFEPGWRKARGVLVGAQFPVDEVERWMGVQRDIEALPELALEDAAVPTTEIARLTFGFAGAGGGAVGAQIGRFLFFMDNLLDFHRDVAEGGYNALARAFAVDAPAAMPEPVVQAGVQGATGCVTALSSAVGGLDITDADYLNRTLVSGFRDKVRRFEALDDRSRERATLRSVMPERMPIGRRLSQIADRALRARWLQARMALALVLMWLFPSAAWAEDWWPEGATDGLNLDTAQPVDTGDFGLDSGDTGFDTGLGPDYQADQSQDCYTWTYDQCCFGWTSSCGWVGDQTQCGLCDNACGDPCGNVCDDACGDACNIDCGNSCGDGCDC